MTSKVWKDDHKRKATNLCGGPVCNKNKKAKKHDRFSKERKEILLSHFTMKNLIHNALKVTTVKDNLAPEILNKILEGSLK